MSSGSGPEMATEGWGFCCSFMNSPHSCISGPHLRPGCEALLRMGALLGQCQGSGSSQPNPAASPKPCSLNCASSAAENSILCLVGERCTEGTREVRRDEQV